MKQSWPNLKYCDMTPESRNSSLLGNGSINTFPRKRTRSGIEEPVSKQWIGKHTTIGVLLETVFSVGAAPSLYNEDLRQLRELKPSARGYNRATLSLGDINTGTWPSRLGESRI
jgi:hypothetical protein